MKLYEAIADLLSQGAEVYEVGGSVRDSLLGRENKDLDLVVRKLAVSVLVSILEKYGTVSMVGVSFSVLKFKPFDSDQVVDIAIPRTERSTGEGHGDFEVTGDPDLPIEDDLKRRDFTINAIARRADGELVDPLNGVKDCQDKVLRIVYPKSFVDDPLRMLRGIQFAARFKLELSEDTKKSALENAHRVKTVSGERIATELMKLLLLAPKPSRGFYLMKELGILQHVLPELQALVGVRQPRKHHNKDAFDHTMVVIDAAANDEVLGQYKRNPEVMLAALFHDLGKADTYSCEINEAGEEEIHFYQHQLLSSKRLRRKVKGSEPIFKRIPFNSVEKVTVDLEEVDTLVFRHMDLACPDETNDLSDRAKKRLVARVGGVDTMRKLCALRVADKRGGANPGNIQYIINFWNRIEEFVSRKEPFSTSDLAINGHDVMTTLGISPGREVGRVLNSLLEIVLEHPEKNTREELLKLVSTV